MWAVPRAERNDSVSNLRKRFPAYRRYERSIVSGQSVLEERPKQFEMLNNFWNIRCAKIIVRHEFEVRFDFIREIGRQLSGYRRLQTLALDLGLLVIGFLVGQITRSGVKQLPDERFLPIRPTLSARALSIGQGQQHQRI